MRETERERERLNESERDKKRARETERGRERHKESERDRKRARETESEREKQKVRLEEEKKNKMVSFQADVGRMGGAGQADVGDTSAPPELSMLPMFRSWMSFRMLDT